MITLAICWKAIGVIAILLGCIALSIFATGGTIGLCMSDSRVKKTIGWSIVGIFTVACLVGLYFIFTKEMCG